MEVPREPELVRIAAKRGQMVARATRQGPARPTSERLARVSDLLGAAIPTLLAFVLGLSARRVGIGQVERLYDLAAKMPAGSFIRQRYEEAAGQAATRNYALMQVPLRVRPAAYYLASYLLLRLFDLSGGRVLPGLGRTIHRRALELQDFGWSPRSALAISISFQALFVLAVAAAGVLVIEAWNFTFQWLWGERRVWLRPRYVWHRLRTTRRLTNYRLRLLGAAAFSLVMFGWMLLGLLVVFAGIWT